MRRKDKQIIDPATIEAVIRKAKVCRLAMTAEDGPYVVPLCFGYHQGNLYFHSAAAGKKIEILKKNPRVCFELDSDCVVRPADKPCKWGMAYTSVIGFGTAVFVEAPVAKREALDVIMHQYGQGDYIYADAEIKKMVVIKVAIDTMTGKASP
jgi:nitroimidazol reductase NimA-like FMN-containing flavoprotein (pyridoxamine 5'-phosphate oxidase superfamily)